MIRTFVLEFRASGCPCTNARSKASLGGLLRGRRPNAPKTMQDAGLVISPACGFQSSGPAYKREEIPNTHNHMPINSLQNRLLKLASSKHWKER